MNNEELAARPAQQAIANIFTMSVDDAMMIVKANYGDFADIERAFTANVNHADPHESTDRYYMDHGVLHDRETGQHMWTQDDYDRESRAAYESGMEEIMIKFSDPSRAGEIADLRAAQPASIGDDAEFARLVDVICSASIDAWTCGSGISTSKRIATGNAALIAYIDSRHAR